MKILDKYIVKIYFINISIIFFSVTAIMLIFDFIELSRIASTRGVPLHIVLMMTYQKVPLHMQKILGFIVVISSLITVLKISSTNEYIAMQSLGVSGIRIYVSIYIMTLFIGVFHVMCLNPIVADLIAKYEYNEGKYFRGASEQISIADNGIWLKSNGDEEVIFIHANYISKNLKSLEGVVILQFDKEGFFFRRYDAKKLSYINKKWKIIEPILNDANNFNEKVDDVIIPLNISFSYIQENAVAADTVSVWKMWDLIALMNKHGISTRKYEVYFYKLITMPIFIMLLSVIGVYFGIIDRRFDNGYKGVIFAITTAFFLYILLDAMSAFSISGDITPVFSVMSHLLLSCAISLIVVLRKMI